MHEVLLVRGLEGVEHLVHLRHGKCAYVEHLGLATLEEARAVSGLHDANLGADRAKVCGLTTVDPLTGVHNTLADDLLLKAARRFLDFFFPASKLAWSIFGSSKRAYDCLVRRISCLVALSLDHNLRGRLKDRRSDLLNRCPYVGAVVKNGLVLEWFANARDLHEFVLQRN